MVSIKNIKKDFDALEVLRGVSLEVERGEVVAVIGPSGSGKSTLLRCLNKLENVDSGEIVIDGETMVSTTGGHAHYASENELRAIREKMGMVFQSFNLFPHYSVLKNVMEPQVIVKGIAKAEAKRRALEMLEKVGLLDKADAYPFQLSGGQAQRVAIARALAMRPKLMSFDEPTSALDPRLTGEVLGVLKALAKEHMTMIIVTHELGFAKEAASRVVFMENGLIIEQGEPKQMLENPTNPDLRQFLGFN